jgi:hypothetical protein
MSKIIIIEYFKQILLFSKEKVGFENLKHFYNYYN